jgi:hypothetical protein
MRAHPVLMLSRAQLAADVLMVVGATILVVLALAALALFAMRRRAGDPSLLSFAAFSLLYAMRLFASTWSVPTLIGGPDPAWVFTRDIVTYVINVPLVIFTEQVLGLGWRNFRRGLTYVVVTFAIVALIGVAVTQRSDWALRANHWLVLGFLPAIIVALAEQRHVRTRAMHWISIGGIIATVFVMAENLHSLNMMQWWPGDIEYVGFIAFTISLAYAVTERFLTDEARLAAVDRALETARRIQQSILPRDVPGVDGLRVTARYLRHDDRGGGRRGVSRRLTRDRLSDRPGGRGIRHNGRLCGDRRPRGVGARRRRRDWPSGASPASVATLAQAEADDLAGRQLA